MDGLPFLPGNNFTNPTVSIRIRCTAWFNFATSRRLWLFGGYIWRRFLPLSLSLPLTILTIAKDCKKTFFGNGL